MRFAGIAIGIALLVGCSARPGIEIPIASDLELAAVEAQLDSLGFEKSGAIERDGRLESTYDDVTETRHYRVVVDVDTQWIDAKDHLLAQAWILDTHSVRENCEWSTEVTTVLAAELERRIDATVDRHDGSSTCRLRAPFLRSVASKPAARPHRKVGTELHPFIGAFSVIWFEAPHGICDVRVRRLGGTALQALPCVRKLSGAPTGVSETHSILMRDLVAPTKAELDGPMAIVATKRGEGYCWVSDETGFPRLRRCRIAANGAVEEVWDDEAP